MVTVEDVLKLPSLSDCIVLSGLSGLSREVHGWNVAERSDFSTWIKGGEFIMSMLSFTPDTHSETVMSGWVNSLINSGVAALGIKRSVYNGVPPKFLVQIGDRNSFPIIEMDDSRPLLTIGVEIFECVLSCETSSLRRGINTFTNLATAAVNGWIPEFVQQLSVSLGNPVILETTNLNLVSSSTHDKVFVARRECACLKALLEKFDSGMNFETDPVWSLKYLRHDFAVGKETYTQFSFPIEIGCRLYGYITVIHAERSWEADDFLMMRVAVNAAALIALKDSTYDIQEEKRYELFSAIIDYTRKDEAESRAMQYGFDTETPAFCAIAKPTEPFELTWTMDQRFLKRITEDVRLIDPGALILRNHGFVVIFCHDYDEAICKNHEIVKCGYTERLGYIQETIVKQGANSMLLLGAGRAGTGVSQYRFSYEEALATIRIAERFGLKTIPQQPIHYLDTKYYSLLDTIMQDESKAWLFCRDILGSLMDSKIKNKEDYYLTLEAYYFYGKNVSEMHRNTGLHRNTIKYRIDKIQELLDVDLSDIQTSVSVWIALQIRKLLDTQHAAEEPASKSTSTIYEL